MSGKPVFPHFRPIELGDHEGMRAILRSYRPETSELTFTNLFMWHAYSKAQWCLHDDRLLIVCRDDKDRLYALPPVGPPPRREVVRMLLRWLRDERGARQPRVERADRQLAAELGGDTAFTVEQAREHFDYVYRTRDLISLAGRKYHGKKNHVNKFKRSYAWRYAPLDERCIKACLEIENEWCRDHHCCLDMSLTGEWEAIRTALLAFKDLNMQGGVIMVNGSVEAFTLGELLNEQTAVVHIEKANPACDGLYAAINQQFCEHAWEQVPYINREQDLGDPGLRQAKLSYHPDRLVEKFRITLSEEH